MMGLGLLDQAIKAWDNREIESSQPSGLTQTDGSLGEWQKSATSGALQGILLLRPNH